MNVVPIANPYEPTYAQKLKAFPELVAMVATLAPHAPEAFRLGAENMLARLRPPAKRPAGLIPTPRRPLPRGVRCLVNAIHPGSR